MLRDAFLETPKSDSSFILEGKHDPGPFSTCHPVAGIDEI